MIRTAVFCIIAAIIVVIVKLMLEHQRDTDISNGIMRDKQEYTFSGMLKIMREERKASKRAVREAKREAKLAAKKERMSLREHADMSSSKLHVKDFSTSGTVTHHEHDDGNGA